MFTIPQQKNHYPRLKDWSSHMYEFGIVKFYDKKKEYGFVYVLDGQGRQTKEEVFFHRNEGRFTEPTSGPDPAPVLCEKGKRPHDVPEDSPLAHPHVHEKLIFRRRASPQGDKADRWAHAERHKQLRLTKAGRNRLKRQQSSANI